MIVNLVVSWIVWYCFITVTQSVFVGGLGGRKGATDDIMGAECVIIAGQNNNLDGQGGISLKQIVTLGTDNRLLYSTQCFLCI